MAKTVLTFGVSKGHLEAMAAGSLFEAFGRVPGREPASFRVRGMAYQDGFIKFEIEVESGDYATAEDAPMGLTGELIPTAPTRRSRTRPRAGG